MLLVRAVLSIGYPTYMIVNITKEINSDLSKCNHVLSFPSYAT